MARSAATALRQLARAAGHPLPAHVPAAQPLQAGAEPATGREGSRRLLLPLGVFAGVFLAAAGGYEVQRRFGREPATG